MWALWAQRLLKIKLHIRSEAGHIHYTHYIYRVRQRYTWGDFPKYSSGRCHCKAIQWHTLLMGSNVKNKEQQHKYTTQLEKSILIYTSLIEHYVGLLKMNGSLWIHLTYAPGPFLTRTVIRHCKSSICSILHDLLGLAGDVYWGNPDVNTDDPRFPGEMSRCFWQQLTPPPPIKIGMHIYGTGSGVSREII